MPSQRVIDRTVAILVFLMAIPTSRGSAQVADAAKPDSLTTLSRVYSAEQATKGREVFQTSCVSCHKSVELAGDKFWSGLIGKTVGDFFGYLRSSMPQDNPGGIGDDDYTNVTAYILQLNAMPAGERPLPGDSASLAKIRVVAPDTTRKGPGR